MSDHNYAMLKETSKNEMSILMYLVYLRLPDFTPEEAIHVKLPSDIEEAKSLGRVIMVYRDTVNKQTNKYKNKQID